MHTGHDPVECKTLLRYSISNIHRLISESDTVNCATMMDFIAFVWFGAEKIYVFLEIPKMSGEMHLETYQEMSTVKTTTIHDADSQSPIMPYTKDSFVIT